MISEKVSTEQAMAFGSKLLRDEELSSTVMKVLNGGARLPAIARVLARHSQIASVILEKKVVIIT